MTEQPIYNGKEGTSLINAHFVVNALLFLAQVILIILLFWFVIDAVFLKVILSILPIAFLYLFVRNISYYKIYPTRIEKLKVFGNNKPIGSIDFSKIDQVRYEDDFGREPVATYNNNRIIYFYTLPDVKNTLIKKGRIGIPINQDSQTEQKLIDILSTVKENGIKIYVSTKYKRLLSELNLKNWTAP